MSRLDFIATLGIPLEEIFARLSTPAQPKPKPAEKPRRHHRPVALRLYAG